MKPPRPGTSHAAPFHQDAPEAGGVARSRLHRSSDLLGHFPHQPGLRSNPRESSQGLLVLPKKVPEVANKPGAENRALPRAGQLPPALRPAQARLCRHEQRQGPEEAEGPVLTPLHPTPCGSGGGGAWLGGARSPGTQALSCWPRRGSGKLWSRDWSQFLHCHPHPQHAAILGCRAPTHLGVSTREAGRESRGAGVGSAGRGGPRSRRGTEQREVSPTPSDPPHSAASRARLGAPAASREPGTREGGNRTRRGPQRPPTHVCCRCRDKLGAEGPAESTGQAGLRQRGAERGQQASSGGGGSRGGGPPTPMSAPGAGPLPTGTDTMESPAFPPRQGPAALHPREGCRSAASGWTGGSRGPRRPGLGRVSWELTGHLWAGRTSHPARTDPSASKPKHPRTAAERQVMLSACG